MMNDILEIPVFADSQSWEAWFRECSGTDQAQSYHAFKHITWPVGPDLDIYFYLVDHFNEHTVKEALSAIIPCAPCILFCGNHLYSREARPLNNMYRFYLSHFRTPVVWLTPEEFLEEKEIHADGQTEEPDYVPLTELSGRALKKAIPQALELIKQKIQKD